MLESQGSAGLTGHLIIQAICHFWFEPLKNDIGNTLTLRKALLQFMNQINPSCPKMAPKKETRWQRPKMLKNSSPQTNG